MNATFIAIEGLDFVGKTTIARLLAERNGWIYYKTPPEPFASMRAGADRLPPKDRLKFFAHATVHASQDIRGLRAAGKSVVADRWIWTTAAYHLARDASLMPEAQEAIGRVLQPDLAVYLEIPAARLWRERAANGGIQTQNDRELLADPRLGQTIHEFFLKLNPEFFRLENTGTPDETCAAIERRAAGLQTNRTVS